MFFGTNLIAKLTNDLKSNYDMDNYNDFNQKHVTTYIYTISSQEGFEAPEDEQQQEQQVEYYDPDAVQYEEYQYEEEEQDEY